MCFLLIKNCNVSIKLSKHSPANWNLSLFGSINDLLKSQHAFINGAVNIFSAEGFWRRPKHGYFSSTRRNLETEKIYRIMIVCDCMLIKLEKKLLKTVTNRIFQFIKMLNSYSILKTLHVRSQNRVTDMRGSLDSSEDFSVVCHLNIKHKA